MTTMKVATEPQSTPQLGDVIRGKHLGYQGSSRYANFIRVACPSCGTHRWARNTVREKSHPYCTNCPTREARLITQRHTPERLNRYRPDAIGKYKTIKSSDIPKSGDLIRGSEVGRNPLAVFAWTPCPSCGTSRWILKNTQGNPMCKDCGNKHKMNKYIGDKSSRWNGGKIVSHYGYVYIRTYPDSPFWSMTNQLGYIAEHRLVMARHLGRPLERWEIVHHKHVRFAAGTIENKQDNRIDNLELVSSRITHDAITILENRIHDLEQQVSELKDRLAMHEAVDDITKSLPGTQKSDKLALRRVN